MFKRILSVLLSRWYWLNYAVSLAVTLPVPMLTLEMNGAPVRRVPVYECYLNVLQGRQSQWNYLVIAIHLGLCFLITLMIWAALYRERSLAPPSEETE